MVQNKAMFHVKYQRYMQDEKKFGTIGNPNLP